MNVDKKNKSDFKTRLDTMWHKIKNLNNFFTR
jgi:hypothetical protein